MIRLTVVARMVAAAVIAGGVAQTVALAIGLSPFEQLTGKARREAIEHAEVWMPTDVSTMDLRAGPQGKSAFAPFATVTCDYLDTKPNGSSAKFNCAIEKGDVVKVKYGQDNVELYAEVAASRLLWALGFGVDAWYPVTVICKGCPADPQNNAKQTFESVTFDFAAIERKMRGATMETKSDEGWSWSELRQVDRSNKAMQTMRRDALTLLAVFLQHTDNKSEQQRLICLSGEPKADSDAPCAQPFMLIHDIGLTFGRANILNNNEDSGINLDRWASVPVWKDTRRCVGKLSQSFTGTLSDPTIGEAGRKFLADLLVQLSDKQLQDMFEVARFDRFSKTPIAAWVELFKSKRAEIVNARCPA